MGTYSTIILIHSVHNGACAKDFRLKYAHMQLYWFIASTHAHAPYICLQPPAHVHMFICSISIHTMINLTHAHLTSSILIDSDYFCACAKDIPVEWCIYYCVFLWCLHVTMRIHAHLTLQSKRIALATFAHAQKIYLSNPAHGANANFVNYNTL